MRHVRRILVIAATGTAIAALSAAPASADGLADVDGLGGEPCVTVLENYDQNGLQITFDRAVAVYSVNQCLG
jgi:hypothetical protein